MEFYKPLYVGDSVRHPDRVLHQLKKGSLMIKAYVITFAAGKDLLEIYNAHIFAQKYYQHFDRPIVGIAGDYREAVDMVVKITEECFAQRGDCALKEYLLERISLKPKNE